MTIKNNITDTGNDPYADLKQHRWNDTTEALYSQARKVPRETRANQKRSKRFVKVPWQWYELLLQAKWAATPKVALHILVKAYESYEKPFKLANGVLGMRGVTRKQKWQAVKELEQLGLISVDRRSKRSPVITALCLGNPRQGYTKYKKKK